MFKKTLSSSKERKERNFSQKETEFSVAKPAGETKTES